MNKPFTTRQACEHIELLKPRLRTVLVAFDDLCFSDGYVELEDLRSFSNKTREETNCSEEKYLNDMFVFARYLDFFLEYGRLWEKIACQNFSDSWNSLQNALDFLRIIKKFSKINIQFFERQLTELEKTYPYKVFASIGMSVEFFECSICGKNIDSMECVHLRGELYSGEMASAIARNYVQLDHVALVKNPKDKRCVIRYDDAGEQFKLLRFVSSLINSQKLRVSNFGHLEFSKRDILNPDYVKQGRNDLCSCGSNLKFKKCCINKTHIQADHVDIIAVPISIENAVV